MRMFRSLCWTLLGFCTWQLNAAAMAALVYVDEERPASLKLPADYQADRSYPLLLILHGFGSSATETTQYLESDVFQSGNDYLVLSPNGTQTKDGFRFWNATPECCDFDQTQVDDSAYLQRLIAQVKDRYSVDASRIYAVGVSNGGFMAYRLACDTEDLLAGVVSFAGAVSLDPNLCRTQNPPSILQIHGTSDEIVPFNEIGQDFPGALRSVDLWVKKHGCTESREQLAAKDIAFAPIVEGWKPPLESPDAKEAPAPIIIPAGYNALAETDEVVWTGCRDEAKVGLWRVNGAYHVPDYTGKNLLKQTLQFFDSK